MHSLKIVSKDRNIYKHQKVGNFLVSLREREGKQQKLLINSYFLISYLRYVHKLRY